MTRQHTLTPEKQRRFLVELKRARGMVKVALGLSHIAPRTFFDWCKRGEAGEEPFATLVAEAMAIRAKEAVDQLDNHARIAGGNSPTASVASASLLGWLMPSEFGQKAQVEAAALEKLQDTLDAVQPLMSAEAYDELITALAALAGHGRMASGEAAGAGQGTGTAALAADASPDRTE